jgi:biopolymer transport protein ExbD
LLSVDDKLVNINDLGEAMYLKITKDPKLTVSLRADENSIMETLTDIHTQLKKAQALKLNYSALSQIEN